MNDSVLGVEIYITFCTYPVLRFVFFLVFLTITSTNFEYFIRVRKRNKLCCFWKTDPDPTARVFKTSRDPGQIIHIHDTGTKKQTYIIFVERDQIWFYRRVLDSLWRDFFQPVESTLMPDRIPGSKRGKKRAKNNLLEAIVAWPETLAFLIEET